MINQLFQTVLFSTLTGSVLILLLIFLSPVMAKKIPAKWRYYLWVPVLLQLLIIVPLAPEVPNQLTAPVVQFADNVTHQRPIFTQVIKQVTPINKNNVGNKNNNKITTQTETVSKGSAGTTPYVENKNIDFKELANNALNVLPLLWVIGCLASLLFMLLGYILYLRKVKGNIITSDLFQTICVEIGIKRKIGLKVSANVTTPMLLGVFYPSVILPEQEYTESELHYIFMHELTHQKRLDLLLRWVVAFVKAIHWFNPLVYLMSKNINQVCELSCDEAVVSRLSKDETNIYGKTILEVLERSRGRNNIAFSTSMCEQNKNRMKSRMLAILNFKKPGKGIVIFANILVVSFIITGLILGGAFKVRLDLNSAYNLPKIQITADKAINWIQGDAHFDAWGTDKKKIDLKGAQWLDANNTQTIQIDSPSNIKIVVEPINGYNKPKISVMYYKQDGQMTSYQFMKDNELNVDFGGVQLWRVYVDWGKGQNYSNYWFKINPPEISPQKTEPGDVPSRLIWKNAQYNIIGTTTTEIGKKLGKVKIDNNQFRIIYRVKGYDPKREIAIEQLGKVYFKAVTFTAEEEDMMSRQSALDSMYQFATMKVLQVPNVDYKYAKEEIVRNLSNITGSTLKKYEKVFSYLKAEKYALALDLIFQLQNKVKSVMY